MQYVLHFISGLSDTFIDLLSAGGYWILSAILVFEALPFVGFLLPGHIVIIAAGFLAKLGLLHLGTVLVTATIATVVGDVMGFLIGRKYGYKILYTFGKYLFVKDEYIQKAIEKTKGMIDTHPGKTIVFGKFSPMTRALTPFLVGASDVHIRTFWFYNIVGGIIWIFASVMIGYVFGASYAAAAQYFGKLMVVATIAIILIIWGFRIVNRKFHVFKKYELFALGLNVLSLWALAKTIQDSFSVHSFMSNFDIAANLFMVKYVTPVIAKTALWVSAVGGTWTMIFLGLAIGMGFLVREKWRRAAIMIFSILISAAIVTLLKEFFLRARPYNALIELGGGSFPSGHATLAAAFFATLAYVSVPHIRSLVKREMCIALCVVLVVMIGLSRIVLNVHWASDVVAGWALGVFIATGCILFIRYVGAYFIKRDQ